jgi:hypothetical protein
LVIWLPVAGFGTLKEVRDVPHAGSDVPPM